MFLSDDASIIQVNGTFWLELVAFIVMVAVMAKFMYPAIAKVAMERQKLISDQLEQAERQRDEATRTLAEAEAKLNAARAQADEVIAGASRSGEQIRGELRGKGEEEAARLLDKARKDIEAARQTAIDSVREQVADMVVLATEKVIHETIDKDKHRRLIDEAINEVKIGAGR